jgi:hypothetical protein
MVRFVALALMALMVAVPSAGAAPIVIDNFATPDPFVTQTGGGLFNPSHSGTGIFGSATRDVSVTLPFGDTAAIGAAIPFGGSVGTLDAFSVFSGVSALTSSLTYTFPAPTDLSGAGISFVMAFVDEGQPAGPPGIVTDITINTATGTLTGVVPLLSSATPVTYTALYNTFSGSGDLTQVNSIVFTFNNGGTPQQGTDFIVTQIQVDPIPEPATLALWGVVGAAGAWYGRRRLGKKAPAEA